MQLKKDDNSFPTNQPNNYPPNQPNNYPPNPPFNMPDNQSYMQNPMDYDMGDTYKQNNVNAFESNMKVNLGSRNVVFNIRSLTIIGFIAIYIFVLIYSYVKIKETVGDTEGPQLAEGYVKTVDYSVQRVTQSGGGVSVTSNEKVYTATYQFEVDGVQYKGTYDSLDAIEPGTKISVVYDSKKPSDNHRQTAEESVKPQTNSKASIAGAMLIIALISGVGLYFTYLRLRVFLSVKF